MERTTLPPCVVGHSSSSILGGAGWDDAVIKAISAILPADVPVTTNGLDCQRALQHLGIKRPFVVFPPWFGEQLVETGLHYLLQYGFSPAGSLRADPGEQWRSVPPAQLYPQGMGFEQDVDLLYKQISADVPKQSDGILIAGTGFRCTGIIDALEQELAVPVVTANQASLWRCLRLTGITDGISGYGRLLAIS